MTVERTTAVGFGSSVARIGGLLAPQVLYLGKINQLVPGKFSFSLTDAANYIILEIKLFKLFVLGLFRFSGPS